MYRYNRNWDKYIILLPFIERCALFGVSFIIEHFTVYCILLVIAECLSARQIIRVHISACVYIYTYICCHASGM